MPNRACRAVCGSRIAKRRAVAPERVVKADAVAAEIRKRCTGEATFTEIIDDLVASFKAPRERIETDVTAMMRQLADKKFLEL
jgi:pyrroloquinoline quinone biosynthesis protein D